MSSVPAKPKVVAPMPAEFAGSANSLYDRHLLFDKAADPATASARDQFEAFARSVRDVLAQRWALTTETYARENPKTVYYLSMEFLIGRSLANNVSNLVLDGRCTACCQSEEPRLARTARAGTGSGPWQRRARAARGLLPGLDGDAAAAGDGLWVALRVRNLPTVDRGWLAARAAGQLAATSRPVGDRPSRRASRSRVRLLVRDAQRQPRAHPRSPLDACAAFRSIDRSSVTAARRSTPCDCGARSRRTISIFSNSAPASSSGR